MDMQESPEEAAIRLSQRQWLVDTFGATARNRNLPPEGRRDQDIGWAKQVLAKLASAGFVGASWPIEYGGSGASMVAEITFEEEARRFGLPLNVFAVSLRLVGPMLIAHGTEEQKRRYLEPLRAGQEIWCALFSEPGAGSDLASLTTSARWEDGLWIVNGQKTWSSGAHYSDFGMLLARTAPGTTGGSGISCFIVDMKSPGVTVRPLRQLTGDTHFNEVFFDEVRLPPDSLVGRLNDGWSVMRSTLALERIAGDEAYHVDIADLIELARSQGRQDHAPTRQRLMSAYIGSEVLRLLRHRIIAKTTTEDAASPEVSVIKLARSTLLKEVSSLAMEILGPSAQAGDGDEATYWRTWFLCAPAIRFGGGTDEIQRNLIAENVLGLPRETRTPVREGKSA